MAVRPKLRERESRVIKISDVERYGESGWSWTVTIGQDEGRKWRTDSRGEGLWLWAHAAAHWGQMSGHLQFQLHDTDTAEAAKKALVEYWRAQERKNFGPKALRVVAD